MRYLLCGLWFEPMAGEEERVELAGAVVAAWSCLQGK